MGDREKRGQEAALRMRCRWGEGGEAGEGGLRPGRWERWRVNEMCNAEGLAECIALTKNLLCT